MSFKKIDELYTLRDETVINKISNVLSKDLYPKVKMPTALNDIALLLTTTEPAHKKEASLLDFAKSQYIRLMRDKETRTKILAFKQLLKKQTPFDEIKSKAKELIDAGFHIHTLGIVLEDSMLQHTPLRKLIKLDRHQSTVSNAYLKYMPHMMAIYANDLEAFQTVCDYTVLFKIMMWKENPELWTPFLKMHKDNSSYVIDLLKKHVIPFKNSAFQKSEIFKQVLDYLNLENYNFFNRKNEDVTTLFMNRIIFDSALTSHWDTLMHRVSPDFARAQAAALCQPAEKNMWTFFQNNQIIDKKTNEYLPDPQERHSYHSALKTLLFLAEKHNLQDLIYPQMMAHVPASCVQDLINAGNGSCTQLVYQWLTYPSKYQVIRKQQLMYAAQLSYKKYPFFWGLYQNKLIDAKALDIQMEKYSTNEMPRETIHQAFMLPANTKPDAVVEKLFFKYFGQNVHLMQTWMDHYPENDSNKRNKIDALFGASLNKGYASTEQLTWLADQKMASYYFNRLENPAQFILNGLNSEQFKTLTIQDDGTLLHQLCADSHTVGIKWMYQKHPDVFKQWLGQKDTYGKIPFDKAPLQFIHKMELRARQSNDTEFADLFADFLKTKGVRFTRPEPVAEVEQTTTKPTVQTPTPTAVQKQTAPTQTKTLCESEQFKQAVDSVKQESVLTMLDKALTHLASTAFDYRKAHADRKGLGDLLTHRFHKHVILYRADFAQQKIVLLDFGPCKECFRKWRDVTTTKQYSYLANKLLNAPTPKKVAGKTPTQPNLSTQKIRDND